LFFLFGPSGKRPVRLQATNWFLFIYLFVPTLNFPPDDHHHLSQQQQKKETGRNIIKNKQFRAANGQ
jgi:hypothetical protein